MDEELSAPELTSLRDLFYARYKMKFPVHLEPSDLWISRIAREVTRRQLQVHSVFKVKTVIQHMRAPAKRQRLAEGLELVTQGGVEEEECRRDVASYLQLHHTLMIAYARAGARVHCVRPVLAHAALRVTQAPDRLKGRRQRPSVPGPPPSTMCRFVERAWSHHASRERASGPPPFLDGHSRRCLWTWCAHTTRGLCSARPRRQGTGRWSGSSSATRTSGSGGRIGTAIRVSR